MVKRPQRTTRDDIKLSRKALLLFALMGIGAGVVESFLYTNFGIGFGVAAVTHENVANTILMIDAIAAGLFISALIYNKMSNHPYVEILEAVTGGVLASFVICNLFMGQLIHIILCAFFLDCPSLTY